MSCMCTHIYGYFYSFLKPNIVNTTVFPCFQTTFPITVNNSSFPANGHFSHFQLVTTTNALKSFTIVRTYIL